MKAKYYILCDRQVFDDRLNRNFQTGNPNEFNSHSFYSSFDSCIIQGMFGCVNYFIQNQVNISVCTLPSKYPHFTHQMFITIGFYFHSRYCNTNIKRRHLELHNCEQCLLPVGPNSKPPNLESHNH